MKFKKILSLLLSLAVILCTLPLGAITVSAASSGTTGACTWTLDDTSLTISGNGVMGNYSYISSSPWGTGITEVIIEDGVTSIGDSAFRDCSSLTSVTISDSVTSIGDYAFCDCSSLTSVTITDSVTSIGRFAFCDCSSLTSVTIPDGVTSIGSYAFFYCDSLTSVTIPDSVTNIGVGAFSGCDSLTSVTIPDSVTSIGSSAFSGCDSLTSITIPDSVTSIGDYVFRDCSSLTSVTIPDSVTSIGSYAFQNCSSLTSITIPDSVTSIGGSAFSGCDSLKNVYITDIEAWCNIEFKSDNANPMYYADNLYLNNQILKDVKIPDGTQIVETDGFFGVKSLKSVYIPKETILIKENVFYGCNIDTVYFGGSAAEWTAMSRLAGNECLNSATIYYNSTGEVSSDISLVAVAALPNTTTYTIGESLDLTGAKIVVCYPEGNYKTFDITPDMVTGFDSKTVGYKVLTVNYKGYTAQLTVLVINIDLNGDGETTAEDLVVCKKALLLGDDADVNGDGVTNVLDFISTMKQISN